VKQVFKIIDEIYGTEIIIFVGTQRQAESYAKKNLCAEGIGIRESMDGCTCTFINDDDESVRFIWLQEYPWTLAQWVVISHEVNHVAFYVLEGAGVDDEEAHCYYHDYLLRKILKTLNKEL
jgi:hypothetical protein